MQFSILRETLLKPLQQVIGVVERRQTLPVLANFLVKVVEDTVTVTGTDLEVEMIAKAKAEETQAGEITLPARKLFDIVRALPDGVRIQLKLNNEKVTLHAGRSRFTLTTLPASEFPIVEDIDLVERVSLPEQVLKDLMEHTGFAMANQDVRYYLNGMLLELKDQQLRCVATDGHRLALKETRLENVGANPRQVIIPRKGVNELGGLLGQHEGSIEIEFGRNHIRVRKDDVIFTSKLIDGKFPDYEAVLPLGADKQAALPREAFRNALQRAAILSNEKYRGVKLELSPGKIRIVAHNPEQEEATEELEADTMVEDLSVGFNVGYLLDALAALETEEVRLNLRDGQSSCLLQNADQDETKHVIMPLRL